MGQMWKWEHQYPLQKFKSKFWSFSLGESMRDIFILFWKYHWNYHHLIDFLCYSFLWNDLAHGNPMIFENSRKNLANVQFVKNLPLPFIKWNSWNELQKNLKHKFKNVFAFNKIENQCLTCQRFITNTRFVPINFIDSKIECIKCRTKLDTPKTRLIFGFRSTENLPCVRMIQSMTKSQLGNQLCIPLKLLSPSLYSLSWVCLS